MVQLELERLLEHRLSELGVSLCRRVYGEEFVSGAAVDDHFGEISVAEYRRQITVNELYEVEEKFRTANELSKKLSDTQKTVEFECVPFFRRKSQPVNGFVVTYDVFSTEKFGSYEGKANSLITEGKINVQFIDIDKENGKGIVTLELTDKVAVMYFGPLFSSSLSEEKLKELAELQGVEPYKFDILMRLDGQMFDPKKVCEAINQFLLI